MRALISGGGIAGLTLAILLKQNGNDVVVIEREPALRREGYMMDFFGTGWDLAERMGLAEALRAVRYPIEQMEFIGPDGDEPYYSFPVERLRAALAHRYVYLRRVDLERILFARAQDGDVEVRFGTSIETIEDRGKAVHVSFDDGSEEDYDLVFGADGVHSNVRNLVFGSERQFGRFLGYHVAAFRFPADTYHVCHTFKLYEEPERAAWLYPLDEHRGDATYIFTSEDLGHVPHAQRLPILRERYAHAHSIARDILADVAPDRPIFFDSVTQIDMPSWHRGRIALLGDACGCLTLMAGQGSHLAMAGAYVLARELACHGDHRAAFTAYQDALKPHVAAKQRDAVRFARFTVPTKNSSPALRHLAIRLIFNPLVLRSAMKFFGARSILPKAAAA